MAIKKVTQKNPLLKSISLKEVNTTKLTYANRLIHFYNVLVNYEGSFTIADGERRIVKFFKKVIELTSSEGAPKFQFLNDKYIILKDVRISEIEKCIYGKILCSRDGSFPEIINKDTGEIRAVEAQDEEDIVETTHFCIDYSRNTPVIQVEFNLYGARFRELEGFLERVGIAEKILSSLRMQPVTRNLLSQLQTKMGLVSEFIVQIDRENLPDAEKLDSGIFTGMAQISDGFLMDFIEIKLKFDYRKVSNEPVQTGILNIVNKLLKKPDNSIIFNKLKIKAQNISNHNKMEFFDLLIDSKKIEFQVEKKLKHRTIVSEHIFELMYKETLKELQP